MHWVCSDKRSPSGRSSRCPAPYWRTVVGGRTASHNRFRFVMADPLKLLTAFPPPQSLARTRPPERAPVRVGLVQERWHPDPDEHEAALAEGARMSAGEGARIVCLQELTLSRYFAITPDSPSASGAVPEELTAGPTFGFARG